MKLRILATTTLVSSAIALLAAAPASAAVSGGFDPIESTIAPGNSTTFVLTLNDDAAPGDQFLTLAVAPQSGATGAVTISSPSRTGSIELCSVDSGANTIDCLFRGPAVPPGAIAGTVTFTATATSDAAGSFVITAGVGQITQTFQTQATLNVQAPAPPSTNAPSTTAAPVTTAVPVTTAAPTTAAPVTTAAPSSGAGTLPATGSNDVSWAIVVLAVMALAGGGVAVRLARRPRA